MRKSRYTACRIKFNYEEDQQTRMTASPELNVKLLSIRPTTLSESTMEQLLVDIL